MLITDPDQLFQGFITTPTDAAWTASSGANTTITGSASLPSLSVGDFFEVRDHSVPGNNGLYQATGTPTTSSVSCTKITGIDPVDASAETVRFLGRDDAVDDEKSVFFDRDARLIYLLDQGNLSVDGVTMLALHSFIKEEWKDDADLIPHPFPMIGIDFDAGKWEFGVDPSGNFNGWRLANYDSRKRVRNAGWIENTSLGIVQEIHAGITTLGTFEDSVSDQAYYQLGDDPTDTAATIDFEFAGPVNEAILFYENFGNPVGCDFATSSTITRSGGNFVTDGYRVGGQVTVQNATDPLNNGTFVLTDVAATTLTVFGTPFITGADSNARLAVDNRNAFKVFLRVRDADPNGKTFAQANLTSAGETALVNKQIKFPLSNATDLKISETDANIVADPPYTEIEIRYFDQAFAIAIDTPGTPRNFGIVVDVGTHSGVDGSFGSGGSVLTSAEGSIVGADFIGGTLIVHEGAAAGTYAISGTPTATEVTITTTFPAAGADISFSLQRGTPVVATAEEIYEKIQYLLRQAADIDDTDQTVTGKTADALLRFVGDTLEAGQSIPSNPNGGGSGVVIVGFDANDTNRLVFFDNTAVTRTYPFVAAGTLQFSQTLVDDSSGQYWLFFEYTQRVTVSDMALSGASGSTASLDSAGANLPTLVQNDYVNLQGFSDPNNNGIWIVTDVTPSSTQADIRKVNGATVSNATGASRTLDKNPIDSPQAIIVDNNAGADIAGAIGATSIGFDFDYDNNVQGGRTPGTNAAVRLRAIGLETAQNAQASFTITRAVGLTFSLTAALERNYSNP
jgi:hypothetical protein